MSVFDLISSRRSIRKFKADPIPKESLLRIFQAGILAPSGNNRQTWKFYVVQGDKRAEMVERLNEGLANRVKDGEDVAGAKHSFDVMAQAPVTVFIFRPNRTKPWLAGSQCQHFSDVVDVQSVGACIQNMLLMAEELGIGSLWICDVFSAYQEISDWLGESTEMIAAVSFGIADEHPAARKRKSIDEVVHWL
ncbi:MAG: nitroreductase family protein [Chloroflexi bacterium]|nr:nitroreductase family protein [Chloroflexota bacterium]